MPIYFCLMLMAVTAVGADISQINSPAGPIAGLYDPYNIGPKTTTVDVSPYARVRYVAQGAGSDVTGDGSAAAPWQTFQHAMAQIGATSSTCRVALLVAEGTYTGSAGTSPDYGGLTVNTVVIVPAWVDLYGGFAAGSWVRDVVAHPTIIDAEWVTNRRAVYLAANTRLDGFTVMRGKLTGTYYYSSGIHGPDHATVANCIVKNNTHGGGMGGGIYCNNSGSIINCRIQGNALQGTGGGVMCSGNSSIANCAVVGNKLLDSAGGGGGIYLNASTASNCVVADNAIGTFAADGGGIACWYGSSAIHCVTTGNSLTNVADGGGIYLTYASTAVNCHAAANSSSNYGSGDGFYCELGGTARNCIATGNKGGDAGSGSGGGGFCAVGGRVVNCIATQNAHSGDNIGGVYSDRNTSGAVINSIIRNNTGPEYVYRTFSGDPDGAVVNCNIEGGWSAGQNTVDSDPQFVGVIAAGVASTLTYTTATSQTVLAVTGANSAGIDLTGWVVQVGSSLAVPTSCFYGVIAACTTNTLVVWGNATRRLDAYGNRSVSITAPANWQVYDYHLKPGSPLFGLGLGPDAGHTSATLVSRFDGDGQSRSGAVCDIGPDELYYTALFRTDGTPGATLDGVTTQSVKPHADCTAVLALAPVGRQLVKWTANEVDFSTSNPVTLGNVTTNTLMVAHFASNAAEIGWSSHTLPFTAFDWRDGLTSATVTITNAAAAGADLNCTLSVSGTFSGEFLIQAVSGGNPIPPGGALVKRIIWDPADGVNVGQLRDASLEIGHNDPSLASPIMIPLGGTSVPVELSVFLAE